LELKKGVNSLSGGRYHNFKDFMSFPDFGRIDFCFQELKANLHPDLASQHSLIHSIQKKDILLHFPYQQFDHIVDLLREASLDPKVKSIHINIYRVARHSEVMNALLACVFNGKEVNVVFELQARFDEENNMNWSNRLKEIGANVIYGMPQLKIHSKLLQIKRIENKKIHYISYIGTGNFNERTSQVYTDLALMTAHREIAHEVARVFKLIENSLERQTFKHLMVSPFNTRKKIMALIEREIKHARLSKPAAIKIKINNLTDSRLIDKLYKASQAGVQIQLIVRGICCLKPGVKGLSDNITAISIVDRFLEHARFFSFHNNGNTVYYLTSADWMERNLDQRIEVGVEVLDRAICEELKLIFDYQWRGSVKARSLSADLANNYAQRHLTPFHAQKELLNFYTEKLEKVTQ
jgi:polyphosphate kinase